MLAPGWLKDRPSNLLGGEDTQIIERASWCNDSLPRGRKRVFKSFHLYGMTKLPSSWSVGNSFLLWGGGLWLARELKVKSIEADPCIERKEVIVPKIQIILKNKYYLKFIFFFFSCGPKRDFKKKKYIYIYNKKNLTFLLF